MKKYTVLFFLLIIMVVSFSEITIVTPLNNSAVSSVISFKWIESKATLKDVSYWEVYCNDSLVAKTFKTEYEWNPESETYPKLDGWYSIVIKAFNAKSKTIDESGINIYIKHHKLVVRLLERTQNVGNSIRFKVASINVYNGTDFPIVDRAEIQLSSSNGGSFSLSETHWSTITSVYIQPGHNESQIIYFRSFKSGYKKIFVQREYWGKSDATVYFNPLGISKISVSSPFYYIAKSKFSNAVRLTFEDKYKNPVNLKKDDKLYLYLTDPNGMISVDKVNWAKNFIPIRRGQDHVDIYYRNTEIDYGNSLIVVGHAGWDNAVVNVYVRSKPTLLKVVLNKRKIDFNEVVAGRIMVLDSKLRDSFFVSDKVVDVFTTSKNGRFATNDGWYPSMRFLISKYSIMSQSFYYKDSYQGTQTIMIRSSLKSEDFNVGVANNVSKLQCVSCGTTTVAGSPIKLILETSNKYGLPVAPPKGTVLLLKAARGKFYASKKLLKPIDKIILNTYKSTITLYYYNTIVGKDGIAIYEYPDHGWKNIYGNIDVSPSKPYKITTLSSLTMQANRLSQYIHFKILDKFNNPIDNSDCTITSNSTSLMIEKPKFDSINHEYSFRIKPTRIGEFKVSITLKDSKITKSIRIISYGYLKSSKITSTVGKVKKIFINFVDSSLKPVESNKILHFKCASSNPKFKFDVSNSTKGVFITVYSTKTGNYTLKLKNNTFIKGSTCLNVKFLPTTLSKILLFPNKIDKKLPVSASPIKFEVKLLDEYGNMANLYKDYKVLLSSNIGKFYSIEKKPINEIVFSKDVESKKFLFKPTKFGTGTLSLSDSYGKIKTTLTVSTQAHLTFSVPTSTTILKPLPITIKLLNADNEPIQPLEGVNITLSASSGAFYLNKNEIQHFVLRGSTQKLFYANKVPKKYLLTFQALGRTFTKTIYVKDVPILSSFKLTTIPKKPIVGNKTTLEFKALDQHGKPFVLDKDIAFKVFKDKNLQLFANGKPILNELTFTKGSTSMQLECLSKVATEESFEFKNKSFSLKHTVRFFADGPESIRMDVKQETYAIYKRSSKIKICFVDKYGNLTKPSTFVKLYLSSTNGGKFYTIKGKELKHFVLTNSSTYVYLMPTKKGSDTIIVKSKDLQSAVMDIFVRSYPYTFKVRTIPPFAEGERSKPVKVYLVDKNNDTIEATKDVFVSLTTDSTTGLFLDRNNEKINHIIIGKNKNQSVFYYKDGSLGDHKIILSSPGLEATSVILSTVKPVKNIEFRDIQKTYYMDRIYKISIVTVNEDGIQWYVGDGAEIEITSDSTSLEFFDNGKWVNEIKVKIDPYSSSVAVKFKNLRQQECALKAFWIDRKKSTYIKLIFKEE